MSGNVYYVTNCGDVSLNAVYSCDSEGNKCWKQYILSRFDNLKTIQMLIIEYLISKIEQKCPAKPEVHSLGMQTHFCTTSHALQIWEKGSVIKEIV